MFIKKLAVTAFCAVFVFASPLLYLYRAENTIMGLPVVSREEAEKIIYSRSERQMNVNILYKGVNLPKADNIHYLSRDRNSRWKGVLTPGADNFKNLKFRVIDPEKSKEDLMSSRETLKIIAYNDTVYNISEIAVTGLPLVYIDIAGTDDTGEMYGTAKVYENDARGRKGVEGLGIYDVSIHVRGNKGDRIPKVSYKMELHNPDGGNLSASLLGMREDDDWVLNPLYTDSSRLREMLGYDIWERIGGSYTHGVEYCEFVLNYLGDCSYQGLYCLNEPVDLSTFGQDPRNSFLLTTRIFVNTDPTLDKGYILENAGNLTEIMGEDGFVPIDTANSIVFEKYLPSQLDDMDRVARFITGLPVKANGPKIIYDRESQTFNEVFIDIIAGSDNNGNNEKICAVKGKDGNYTLYKSLWDLDYIMGNREYTLFPAVDRVIPDFISDGSVTWSDKKELYAFLREELLTSEWIDERLDYYVDLLTATGAYERERNTWTRPVWRDTQEWNGAVRRELELPSLSESSREISNWMSRRLRFLDSYYSQPFEPMPN